MRGRKSETLLKYIQPNNWTCGPACVKVALDNFAIKKSLTQLTSDLDTNSKDGTSHENIIKEFLRNKIDVREKKGASIQDILIAIRHNLIIVGYWIPYYKESHYAIVKKIFKDRIYLHDTWFGPHHSYSIKYFLKNWWDEENKRWMLALNK